MSGIIYLYHLFFFNDTATTEIYPLSLHDALPICQSAVCHGHAVSVICRTGGFQGLVHVGETVGKPTKACERDRKSTRLNSSHVRISYAVFCLKKKQTRSETHL